MSESRARRPRPRLSRVLAEIPGAERPLAGLARLPLRSPTLPPATSTNHYLVGAERSVLVDPATPHRACQRQLFAAIQAWQTEVAPVQAVLLSHHHNDHIAAASIVSETFDIPIIAHAATAALLKGRVAVTGLVEEGQAVAHDRAGPWTAWHTPGHAPGHLVLRGPDGGMVAGDMVAGEGTILIDPRDGHMGEYLSSLRRMRAAAPPWLAPAHGHILRDGDAVLERYIAHRLAREQRVHSALTSAFQPADALLPIAYGDAPRRIWPLALRAMRAHLLDLQRQGRADVDAGGRWRAIASA